MSAYLPSDVNENLDDYFDLPDAGEDEVDEGDYCKRCGAMLTECDEDFEACTQCGFRLRDREK